MADVEEAQEILRALGMPPAQHNRMSGLTVLALCELTPDTPRSAAKRTPCTVTKGIMDYLGEHYGAEYAPNTRETFRRQVLHQFVQGRIADHNPFDPSLPTNSPNAHYAVADRALEVIRLYGTTGWTLAVDNFRRKQVALVERYERERHYNMVPIKLPDGQSLYFSPGKHNEAQKAIVEEFVPRFAPGANLLYLGDTANKNLFVDNAGLAKLGIPITEHDKLPDVVLLADCDSHGVVWIGNRLTFVASDGVRAQFQYDIRLDEIVAAEVDGRPRAEGVLELDRPLQEMFGSVYFPIPLALERFLVPTGNNEIRLDLHCEWIDMGSNKLWEVEETVG